MKKNNTPVGAICTIAVILLSVASLALAQQTTNKDATGFGKWLAYATKRASSPAQEYIGKERYPLLEEVALRSYPFVDAPWWHESADYYRPGSTAFIQNEDKRVPVNTSEFLATFIGRMWIHDTIDERVRPTDFAECLSVSGILCADTTFGGVLTWDDMYGLSSTQYQNLLISWAEPVLAKAWPKTQPEGRHAIRECVKVVRAYVKQFDLEAELAWNNKVQQIGFASSKANNGLIRSDTEIRETYGIDETIPFDLDERLFLRLRPDGKTLRPLGGKLEAFIFRRISSGDMTAKRVLELCDKAESLTQSWDEASHITPADDAAIYTAKNGTKIAAK